MSNRKADAFLTLAVDVMDGKTHVTGYLRRHTDPEVQLRSFSCLATDAVLFARLPEWLAELRAEAALGRLETLTDQQDRLAGYWSGSAETEIISLNSTCTSRLPDGSGPRSLTR